MNRNMNKWIPKNDFYKEFSKEYLNNKHSFFEEKWVEVSFICNKLESIEFVKEYCISHSYEIPTTSEFEKSIFKQNKYVIDIIFNEELYLINILSENQTLNDFMKPINSTIIFNIIRKE